MKVPRDFICHLVELKSKGWSYRRIGNLLGVSKATVHYAMHKRQSRPSNKTRGSHAGRPRKLENEFQDVISRALRRSPFMTANDIVVQNRLEGRVSRVTVARFMHEFGLRSMRPNRKPFLTRAHRIRRLRFAKQYRGWSSVETSRRPKHTRKHTLH